MTKAQRIYREIRKMTVEKETARQLTLVILSSNRR
jgi:predicted PP-loop superfamily ATPase